MNKIKALTILLLLAIIMACSTTVNEDKTTNSNDMVELIKNGDASNGTEWWGVYAHPPAEGSINATNGEIEFAIGDTGSDNWHIQGHYAGLTFIEGEKYVVSVDMYSTLEREAQIRIQLDSDPYSAYLEEMITLTPEKQTFNFEFVMEYPTDKVAKFCFNLGTIDGNHLGKHSVFADNLSITTGSGGTLANLKEDIIAINQIGYRTNGLKEVRINEPAAEFNLIESSTNKVVFTGNFAKPIDDTVASGEMVYVGDFSDFTTNGEYFIEVPELGVTETFKINNDVYNEVYDSILNLFLLQRCGIPLSPEDGGPWAHDACHVELATIYGTNEKIDVTGGWHDAGDYGRYTGPGSKAVADIILSGNLTPTVLEEIRFKLDWLLKMQDKATGGVYHKVTTADFPGSIQPDEDLWPEIVSPISSTATGQFTAVTAMASRVFKSTDAKYAEKLLQASLKSWKWLEANPVYPGFVNPKGITTGEYGDPIDGDERYWAAIELFLATENETFHKYAIDTYSKNKWNGTSWINMGDYGNMSYISSNSTKKNMDFNKLLITNFVAEAEELNTITNNDGYGISLLTYDWGSNGNVSDNAFKLVFAYNITGNKEYLENAERHLHYLLGSNSLGYSYVTGFGHKQVQNPHHRPSNATGQVVPGMLAGGPNQFLNDPAAKGVLTGQPPQKCYLDVQPSYSTNEITIYWNSPLYAFLTAFAK